ncbi:uncharacterized protein F5891DRAFT_479267 [Suillus fuscotomentosus]|uniref:Uncharacterized protein n=1 Tax=Suillus fuscotomentosus TaxID=1912939 RepID=A0AAD4EIK4_9AGAM|nr:uncharacterized protein F5891DRAFT_479267 [Suillus fuscotomentosus]KAG1906785.1 hypothetical protein F5891DRAFT_479267 [Suillus fuscotomentosus]
MGLSFNRLLATCKHYCFTSWLLLGSSGFAASVTYRGRRFRCKLRRHYPIRRQLDGVSGRKLQNLFASNLQSTKQTWMISCADLFAGVLLVSLKLKFYYLPVFYPGAGACHSRLRMILELESRIVLNEVDHAKR